MCHGQKSQYWGWSSPPFHRNPSNGYINPYYWVEFPIPYYMEIMGVDRPWHKYHLGHKEIPNFTDKAEDSGGASSRVSHIFPPGIPTDAPRSSIAERITPTKTLKTYPLPTCKQPISNLIITTKPTKTNQEKKKQNSVWPTWWSISCFHFGWCEASGQDMARNDGCFHFAAAEGVGEDGAIGGTVVGHQQIQLTILGSMKKWKKNKWFQFQHTKLRWVEHPYVNQIISKWT